MLRTVILSDKAKQILCFLDLLIILVICGVFHMGIHYLQSMETKIRLGASVVLLSVQYNNYLACLCLEPQLRLSPLFATRLLIHAQYVSKIICRFLSVGLVLTLEHLCSIDAVNVLIQRNEFCTYFNGIQSPVMNMLIFFYYYFFHG